MLDPDEQCNEPVTFLRPLLGGMSFLHLTPTKAYGSAFCDSVVLVHFFDSVRRLHPLYGDS